MLTSVRISNYRTCLNTSFRPHPELSVLIGPNGSGKTNLLHAIAILKQLATEARFSVGARDVPTVSSSIVAEFALPSGPARLTADVKTFTDENNRDVIVDSRQRWTLPGITTGPQIDLPLIAALYAGAEGRLESRVSRDLWLWSQHQGYALETLPKKAWPVVRGVAEFLSNLHYYGASQFTNPARSPVSFEIEENEGVPRRSRQGGHAGFLNDLWVQSKGKRNSAYTQFLDIVGPNGLHLIDSISFTEIPTSSINYSVQVGGRVGQQTRSKVLIVPQLTVGKQTLSPNQLSEGTFRTLAVIFYLTTQPSSLILLEEPEVCVHHGLLNSILDVVKVYSRQKQIILSSHSEYVLDHMKPENVFSVTFTADGGTKATSVVSGLSRQSLEALRKYLRSEGNLGEYWRSGGLEE